MPTISERPEDRRLAPRLKVRKIAFAAISANQWIMGPLDDISASGLAMEYTGFKQYDSQRIQEIQLFSKDHQSLISDLPCRVVYDVAIEDRTSFIGLEARRCGIKFGLLNEGQRTNLKEFINKIC